MLQLAHIDSALYLFKVSARSFRNRRMLTQPATLVKTWIEKIKIGILDKVPLSSQCYIRREHTFYYGSPLLHKSYVIIPVGDSQQRRG